MENGLLILIILAAAAVSLFAIFFTLGWRKLFVLAISVLASVSVTTLLSPFTENFARTHINIHDDSLADWLITVTVAFIFFAIISLTLQQLQTKKNSVVKKYSVLNVFAGFAGLALVAFLVHQLLRSFPQQQQLSHWLQNNIEQPYLSVAAPYLATLNGSEYNNQTLGAHDISFDIVGAQVLIEKINTERRTHGHPPLKHNYKLQQLAEDYVADMYSRNYFSHNTPEGTTPFMRMRSNGINYVLAGENLARAGSVTEAHDALMQSPSHRANILNHDFGQVGIAVLRTQQRVWIVQEFTE